jgi:hypothetical protein
MNRKTLTNEEVRQRAERLTRTEDRIHDGIDGHPTAVRWTFSIWDTDDPNKGLWHDIEVYDADDKLVWTGQALDFVHRFEKKAEVAT